MPSIEQLNGLLNRMGNFDPFQYQNDFDKRLILQKAIYLLQAFGLNIGYRYSWYLRGPYCPDLTKVAYSVANDYDPHAFSKFCDAQDEERFCEFLRFLGDKKDDQEWMEVTASIHFLAKLYGEQNEQLVFDKIHKKMGRLSRETFIAVWNNLRLNGLLAKKIT